MFRRRPTNPYSQLFGGMVFFGMATWFTCTTVMNYMNQQAAATRYERVSARIVHSQVKETVSHSRSGTRRHYSPDIQYRYVVAGVPYVSDRYCYFGSGCDSRTAAKQIVGRFGTGRQVVAHYNPTNPNEAVLNNDPPAFCQTQALVMGIMWFGGFLLMGMGLYRIMPRRSPRQKIPESTLNDLSNERFYNPTLSPNA